MQWHAALNRGFVLLLAFSSACSICASAETRTNADVANVKTNSMAEELTELSERARRYFQQGDFATAQSLLEVCLEKTEKNLGPEHASVASLLGALGDCSLLLGDLERGCALSAAGL